MGGEREMAGRPEAKGCYPVVFLCKEEGVIGVRSSSVLCVLKGLMGPGAGALALCDVTCVWPAVPWRLGGVTGMHGVTVSN